MDIIRCSVVLTLLGLTAPSALLAQFVARGGGFSMTINGAQQGAFPGAKDGTIGGVRFSHAVRSPRDAASGLPTGKRQHSPVVFTKPMGVASPQIFKALVDNENLPSVTINLPGGERGAGYRVKLTNAAVSEVKQYTEGTGSGSTVLEDVSFTYQKIEVQDLGTGTLAADDWMAQAAN